MLLIGMWTSLTKKPMNPMMRKPTPVALAMRVNSLRSGLVHFLTKWIESLANCLSGSIKTSLKPSLVSDMIDNAFIVLRTSEREKE
jgi:hypothetical protein